MAMLNRFKPASNCVLLILLCWFDLFYFLVFEIVVLLAPYVCFHILS